MNAFLVVPVILIGYSCFIANAMVESRGEKLGVE